VQLSSAAGPGGTALSEAAQRVVAAMLQGFPNVGVDVHDAAEARAVLDRAPVSPPTVAVAEVHDEVVPAAAGGWVDAALGPRAHPADVAVRVYRPEAVTARRPEAVTARRSEAVTARRPIVVFVHGGGWVLGDLDRTDGTCRRLADALGAVLVSVDHRLAPEHPFPAGLRDLCAALAWAAGAAPALGADPACLVVAGDSSGGNLAAAAALAARDAGPGAPALALQLLLEPALDASCSSASYHDPDLGGFVRPANMHWFWDQYLPEPADRADPLASPLEAPDLAGLAPAIVVATGHDPLRDEAAAYARRLAEAGVPVGHRCYGGLFHGAPGLAEVLPEAATAMAEVVRWVLDVLAGGPIDGPDVEAAP
jgi:acetyl esterase